MLMLALPLPLLWLLESPAGRHFACTLWPSVKRSGWSLPLLE